MPNPSTIAMEDDWAEPGKLQMVIVGLKQVQVQLQREIDKAVALLGEERA